MDFIFGALIMGLPLWIGLSILWFLEREPKRFDLPEKLYPEEPVADRICRRDMALFIKRRRYRGG